MVVHDENRVAGFYAGADRSAAGLDAAVAADRATP
jgi:hypothetical protein